MDNYRGILNEILVRLRNFLLGVIECWSHNKANHYDYYYYYYYYYYDIRYVTDVPNAELTFKLAPSVMINDISIYI